MLFALLGRHKVSVEKKLLKLYVNKVPVYKDFKRKFCFALAFRPEDLKHLLLISQRLKSFI